MTSGTVEPIAAVVVPDEAGTTAEVDDEAGADLGAPAEALELNETTAAAADGLVAVLLDEPQAATNATAAAAAVTIAHRERA